MPEANNAAETPLDQRIALQVLRIEQVCLHLLELGNATPDAVKGCRWLQQMQAELTNLRQLRQTFFQARSDDLGLH
jgi:hypothetical protein